MLSRAHLEQALVWGCIALPWLALGYGVRFAPFGVPTTALELSLLGLFALFTASRGVRGWITAWNALPYRWMWLAWVVVGGAAALYAPSMLRGLGLWRAYILEPVLVLALLPILLTEARHKRALVASLFLAASILSCWAILQYVTGYGLLEAWNTESRRATGPYSYPNAVALFVAPIAALAGGYAALALSRGRAVLQERIWKKERLIILLSVFTAITGFLASFAAKSDGGMLAILGAWGVILLAHRWGRWLIGVGTVIAGSALALLPTFADALWKNLTFQGWSGRVRVWMWTDTLAMLREHWFLGAGMAGYPVVFDAFHTKRFIEIFQYPHQILLTAWSEVGLVGLGIFCTLLVTWALRTWKASHEAKIRVIGLAPLVAIVIHGLVDVPYWKNDLAVVFVMLWWIASLSFEDLARKKADG